MTSYVLKVFFTPFRAHVVTLQDTRLSAQRKNGLFTCSARCRQRIKSVLASLWSACNIIFPISARL